MDTSGLPVPTTLKKSRYPCVYNVLENDNLVQPQTFVVYTCLQFGLTTLPITAMHCILSFKSARHLDKSAFARDGFIIVTITGSIFIGLGLWVHGPP